MALVLHPDLREFLFSLKRADVRFVVIGAYVLATLGRPRYSDDLDVFVEPSRSNAERLARALREYGGFEELARAVPEHMAIVDRMEAWAGRRDIEIEGASLPFLGKNE